MDLDTLSSVLRTASRRLLDETAAAKNAALRGVIGAIDSDRRDILRANGQDVARARSEGMKESLIDRLSLTDSRIDGIIDSINIVINQDDPVGECAAGWRTPEGLDIRQVRVPLGVAAIIYESRPNVTVDAFALAYKSGNAILLRGSSSALESNRALVQSIQRGLSAAGGIADAVALADSGDRADVSWILNARGKIDVVLPRGGAQLIRMVVDSARIPVIETGSGVCHVYVDDSADIDMAVSIAVNAKLQRPGVCNAAETLLVHSAVIGKLMPRLAAAFSEQSARTGVSGGAELRCCARTLPCVLAAAEKDGFPVRAVPASDDDYGYEFLDYILAVKAVDSVDEAIEHINTYNTRHSECIVTSSLEHARLFQKQVDAACVYVNASTRFTDGGVFGFGAELGVSTQKLHVRGPMGLTALTTTKYCIDGEGQTR